MKKEEKIDAEMEKTVDAEPAAGTDQKEQKLSGPKRFRFRDTDYELGKLTEAEKEFLRQFPEQVPYLGEGVD